jgi:predicted Zn-dependent protease
LRNWKTDNAAVETAGRIGRLGLTGRRGTRRRGTPVAVGLDELAGLEGPRLPEETMPVIPVRHAVAALLLASLLTACATNPVSGRRELALMSEAQEIELGRQTDAEIRKTMGVYNDPELQRYVQQIGLKLAASSERPHLPWSFAVVDSPAINAFAVPGGFIYLTRGILPFLDDEAELAGVLGHEIGHVTARHTVAAYSRQTAAGVGLGVLGIFIPALGQAAPVAQAGLGALFLKYGRDDEREADRLGVAYNARNGWDPAGVAGMLNTLARLEEAAGERRGVPNWLSTHPAPADRVQEIQTFVAEARTTSTASATNEQAFLRRIDGIIFGDSPEKGVVRGADFQHSALRFAMRFPEGWPISNTDAQVAAKRPNAEHYVLLELVPAQGGSLEQIAQQQMAKAGFRPVNASRTRINGLDAVVGTYSGSLKGMGQAGARAAHILHGDRVYLIVGLAPAAQFSAATGVFDQTIGSFRPLTAAQAAAIRPNRINLYTARAGDTWQALVSRSSEGMRPSTLAIMNDYEPAQPPRAGDVLKIVVIG